MPPPATRTLPVDALSPVLWSTPIDMDPLTVAHARRQTARLMRSRASEQTTAAILLVVSELVTNVLMHGHGYGGQFVVAVSRDRVHVETIDVGFGGVHQRTPSLEGAGGFGLHIVEALSRRWGHDDGPPTRVWAEIALPRTG
jgi:two-component sensor histidine kinase